jgi:hypothetical protein
MRKDLCDRCNVADIESLNMVKVEELWDALVTNKKMEVPGLDHVCFPLMILNFVSGPESFQKFDFDFQNGGQFLCDNILNDNDVISILGIMSELVRFPYLLDNKELVDKKSSTRAIVQNFRRISK